MIEPSTRTLTKFPPPFFIMGCPRTGTTLVGQILDNHSRIAVYLETNYYQIFRPLLHLYGDLNRRHNLRRLVTDFLEAIKIQRISPPTVEEFEAALVASTFEGVLTTFLHLHTISQGKKRSGEKTPTNYIFLSEILEKFPDSPVVFLVRDPRDTVLSMRKAFDISIENAAKMWQQAYNCYIGASRIVHLVRYEELARNVELVVRDLCDYVGETYEPAMLRFFERIPEHIQAIPHLDLGKLSSPVNTHSIGKFRKMPAEEVCLVEAICAEGMQALGYALVSTAAARAKIKTRPNRTDILPYLIDRLRYYRLNRERWRRGYFRWKKVVQLHAHYLMNQGPFQNKYQS